MSSRLGGGWRIMPGGTDANYNTFCYAGNGCTILDPRIADPFDIRAASAMDQIAVEIAEKGNGCAVDRVDDRSIFSDDQTLCPSGPTEASVVVCRQQGENVSSLGMFCGEASVLAVHMVAPTQENFVIDQFSVGYDFQSLSFEKDIPGYSSDAECLIQGSRITCGPGMTFLFVVPYSGDCQGKLDNLLETTCPLKSGFQQIGCCPISDFVPQNEPPIAAPTAPVPPTDTNPPPTSPSGTAANGIVRLTYSMMAVAVFTLAWGAWY